MRAQSRPPGGRVLVIGGGIAGLSIAAGLRRAGVDVALFERAARWRDLQQGSFINIQVNGMRALRALGLFESIRGAVIPLEAQEFLSGDGTESFGSWPAGKMAREFELPDGVIARSTLLKALIAALEPGVAHVRSELVGFSQDGDGVVAHFADGHDERGDALIGADGLRSVVRRQLLGPHQPRSAGYWFTRGYTISAIPDGLTDRTKLYMGIGAWFGLYPMPRGRMCWFSIAKDNPHATGEPKEMLVERHRGWDPLVVAALGASESAALQSIEVVEHEPVAGWGSGRVTLAGDAAHAMPNTIAQGASQGLEDAAVLVASLVETADVQDALRSYESRRIARATEVQARSHRLGAMFVSEEEMRACFTDSGASDAFGRELAEHYEADMAYPFVDEERSSEMGAAGIEPATPRV